MQNGLINKILFIGLLAAFVVACKKESLPPQERLFRPVLKGEMESEGNFIKVAWQKMEGAVGYQLELSRDTFKTLERSVNLDSSRYEFRDLLWNQGYQLQVKAIAVDTSMNSKFSYLGSIKTPRFPSILNVPGFSDILPTKVKVTWVTAGAAVTNIKILLAADSTVARDVDLDDTDVSANFKVVSGLKPATPYIIYLYSGTSVRGWADFTTTDQLSGTIVDLTDIIDQPTILVDTLPFLENGSTVLLKKGQTYNINKTVALSKSVTIAAGPDLLVDEPPLLYFTSNFNFAASATVDYVRFENLRMRSDNFASRYVFNVTAPANVGEITFTACEISVFRGVTRLQNQAVTVGKFAMDLCLVDSISNYGVLNVDGASALVSDMMFTNSTISKVEKFITSTKATGTMNGILVENCTLVEAAWGGLGTATGNTLIDCNNQKFTGIISFKNNIIGPGWKRDNVIMRGIRPGLGSILAENNFLTSDASIAIDFPIPDAIQYSKPSSDIFVDWENGNFKIRDSGFPGRSTSGDPRWRL